MLNFKQNEVNIGDVVIAKVELTDTFNGEANYSWVKRAEFNCATMNPKGLVRRAKKEVGLNGVKCTVFDAGDFIEIRPIGMRQVCFVTFD